MFIDIACFIDVFVVFSIMLGYWELYVWLCNSPHGILWMHTYIRLMWVCVFIHGIHNDPTRIFKQWLTTLQQAMYIYINVSSTMTWPFTGIVIQAFPFIDLIRWFVFRSEENFEMKQLFNYIHLNNEKPCCILISNYWPSIKTRKNIRLLSYYAANTP